MTINESLDSVGDLAIYFQSILRLGGGATPRDMYLENYVYVQHYHFMSGKQHICLF